ncbi:hypothetical protein [Spirosoma flavum]|uniref:Beta-carotene 15,15'-monooxygenase n=1 Tax=Spirosoma flavum TaxID=2048557 RepID=A0ABW6AE69_9BACT
MTFPRRFITPRIVAFLLLTVLLIWIEMSVARTVTFSQQPIVLSIGVLFDLVFVTTGVFYWLVAKPLRLASSRLIFVALLMLRVALFILPQTSLLPNQIWPFLVVFSEGLVLLIAGLNIRTIVRTYRNLRLTTDAETALRGSLTTVFGKKATELIIGEGLVLYYLLLGWRLRSDIPVDAQPLTTHRQSGQIALVIGILMVGVVEGSAVHLLLARWHPMMAFWITLLSGYGMLFFVADIIATVKRPSYITANQLHLRLGVRWRATIPRSTIATSSLISEKPTKQIGQLNGSFLTIPNVLLTFNEPICFLGPYGISKEVCQFAFFVDDPVAFVRLVAEDS